MKNTILCVKWGDKYSREYVEKLKQQCEDNCSVPFNFYCLTDKKEKDYDILLPFTFGIARGTNKLPGVNRFFASQPIAHQN